MPTDALISSSTDSVGTAPAGSLSKEMIEAAKAPAGDSLSTTTVKPLENTQPTGTVEVAPATKSEIGPEPASGTNKETTPATKPTGTQETVAPKKASNN